MFGQIPIPNEIELLANLTNLNLSNVGFVGQIPIGLAKLTNLVWLDLSSLSFNELPQLQLTNPNFETVIGNLSNLRALYPDGVNISANGHQWCATVARLTPKLKVLSLSSCSITGPINSSLAELPNLSVLRLDQNELNSSVPKAFVTLPSLSEILMRRFRSLILINRKCTFIRCSTSWSIHRDR